MYRLAVLTTSVLLCVTAVPLRSAAQTPASAHGFRASRVILRVSDLGKSIAFYRDQIGLRLQMTTGEFAIFDADGVAVMLASVAKTPSEKSAGLAALTEVVLDCPDILGAYAAMQTRGVTFRVAPRAVTTDGTRDLYAADFRDPDGHILSITGWIAHKPTK